MARKSSRNAPPGLTDLADRLHSASIRLLRRVRREDAQLGLTAARLSALSVVVFGGPIRISDLARAEQVTPPTISLIVASLEAGGYLERDIDARDARASLLRATARGRRLLNQGRRRRVALLAADLAALSTRDLAVLDRAADILARTFGQAPPTTRATSRVIG